MAATYPDRRWPLHAGSRPAPEAGPGRLRGVLQPHLECVESRGGSLAGVLSVFPSGHRNLGYEPWSKLLTR